MGVSLAIAHPVVSFPAALTEKCTVFVGNLTSEMDCSRLNRKQQEGELISSYLNSGGEGELG